jgi:hypothetical protein
MEMRRVQRTAFQDKATLYRDYASLSQADEREEGRYNAMARGRAVQASYGAIERTREAIEASREAHLQVGEQNEELMFLQQGLNSVRIRIGFINQFLAQLMTEYIPFEQGYGLFAGFIAMMLTNLANYYSSIGEVFCTNDSLVEFYIPLRFGERKEPLAIPAWLAYKYWPEEMEKVYREDRRPLLEQSYSKEIAEGYLEADLANYRRSEVVIHIGKAAIKKYDNLYWLPDLPERVFSDNERKTLLALCEKEIQSEIIGRYF